MQQHQQQNIMRNQQIVNILLNIDRLICGSWSCCVKHGEWFASDLIAIFLYLVFIILFSVASQAISGGAQRSSALAGVVVRYIKTRHRRDRYSSDQCIFGAAVSGWSVHLVRDQFSARFNHRTVDCIHWNSTLSIFIVLQKMAGDQLWSLWYVFRFNRQQIIAHFFHDIYFRKIITLCFFFSFFFRRTKVLDISNLHLYRLDGTG